MLFAGWDTPISLLKSEVVRREYEGFIVPAALKSNVDALARDAAPEVLVPLFEELANLSADPNFEFSAERSCGHTRRGTRRAEASTLVAGNTYRHPAILANMVATLDNLSGGRVVLGIGSGWQQNEHEAYGIEYGTAVSRLKMLDEACQIFKGLFNNDYFDFDGEFYQLTNAPLEPKPMQEKLPLMVGGGGEKLTLRIAAKYADEWNVWGDVDTLIHKMRILDQHCEAVGRDPAEIERSAVALLFLTDNLMQQFIAEVASAIQ